MMKKNQEIEAALEWRYATKRFDPAKKISAEDWHTLEKSLILSPSSFGLQPWKFIVVQDSGLRKKIREAAWNQPQIEEASHLVVLACKKAMGQPEVDKLIGRMSEVRGVKAETLAEYRGMMLGFLAPGTGAISDVKAWTTHQTYLALGMFLATASHLGIDACPMEGFLAPKVDEILGLAGGEYASVVIAAAGYRSSDDKLSQMKKVRYAREELVSVR
jgi:nitroreductase